MLVLASSPAHDVQTRRLDDLLARFDRTAPPPTAKLVTRSGALAARKSAAAVPLWPEDVGQGLLHSGHGRISFADRDLGGFRDPERPGQRAVTRRSLSFCGQAKPARISC